MPAQKSRDGIPGKKTITLADLFNIRKTSSSTGSNWDTIHNRQDGDIRNILCIRGSNNLGKSDSSDFHSNNYEHVYGDDGACGSRICLHKQAGSSLQAE